MRTAIYVFKPATVTIRPHDPHDRELTLTPYNPKTPSCPATGSVDLAPGVYLIVSRGKLHVTGHDIRVEASLLEEKDPRPDSDPYPEDVIKLETGATAESIKQFFQLIKGIDISRPAAGVPGRSGIPG